MKANKGQVERAFDAGGDAFRLFLLYGPDESGSQALLQRLARALGADADKVELDGATLKADPARLADEAASFSLFGEKRYIVATLSGDEAMPAVEGLMQADTQGNPVVLLCGTLKPSSAVLKLLLANDKACCLASYVPGDADFAQIATALAQEQGLRIDGSVARALVKLAGNDRAILAREIEKLALYLDASPATPYEAGHDALAAIGADNGEPDLSGLTDAVFSGKPELVAAQLTGLAAEGIDGIGVLRAVSKRAQLLLKFKGEMEQGKSVDTLVQTLFWKERPTVTQQLRRWTPDRLAIAADRLFEAERAIKASRSAGPILADAELIMIARAARR
jgi:DNA polymerase III subunit delta